MPPPLSRTVLVTTPLFAAFVAILLSDLVPLLGPLMLALALGAVVANAPALSEATTHALADVSRTCLRLGIVVLGLRLSVSDLLSVGWGAALVVIATVAVTYAATCRLGDALGLDRGLVTLIAAGFSVCGAAAIAAVRDGVRTRQRNVALAVALVTVYGTAMIVLLPPAARLLGLSTEQAAVWAGASIHEVAQVVATGSLIGGTLAVALATTVKLGRVVTLAGVYVVAARRDAADGAGEAGPSKAPLVPWFVTGFVLAVLLRSTGVLGESILDVGDHLATLLLGAGMFGLGLGLRLRELWPVPARALVLATASTLVAATTSLVLVVTTSLVA
ncbi:YeiH family protein [Mumia zhuanghuii]|uniref:YeiH family protein n=1 Tax=Mumia zhuanghuii TaxID=2585211 RepID=UPI0036442E6A